MNISLSYLSCFSVIKRFNYHDVYAQILLPLLGIFHLFKDGRILYLSLPLLGLIGTNMVSFVGNGLPLEQLLRLGQLFLTVMFFNHLSFNLNDSIVNNIIKSIALLSIILFAIELLFIKPKFFFSIGGFSLPRYSFIVGEVNFSGAVFLGMFFLSLLTGQRAFAILFLVFALFTLSRAVFLSLCVFFILYIAGKITSRFQKILFRILLAILLLYPLLPIGMNTYLPDHMSTFLGNQSPRYYLHATYSLEGIKNPFGAGYFQSLKKIKQYHKKYKMIVSWHKNKRVSREAHSLQIQVLSDFGLTGYILFALFIMAVFRLITKNGRLHTICFLALLVNFTFLNGLSEWIFYFFTAFNINHYLKKDNFLSYL